MSIPTDYISDLLNELSQGRLDNLITQADARRILQEVKEIPENYPDFDPLLTEKATHIAYASVSYTHLDVYKRQPGVRGKWWRRWPKPRA